MKNKKVKSVYYPDLHYLYYLNNKLILIMPSYQDICDYCKENNLTLVKSTGL